MIRHLIAVVLAAFALNAFAAADANQATRAELETVKGIGPGLSGKIIEARKAGDFKSWNDLVERVGGIGAGNVAKLSQAGLTVQGSAFQGQDAAPAASTASTKSAKAKKGDKAKKAEA